ncbi:hypothetical protein EMIT053CA3_130060 [Pseudomonas donghuensis]
MRAKFYVGPTYSPGKWCATNFDAIPLYALVSVLSSRDGVRAQRRHTIRTKGATDEAFQGTGPPGKSDVRDTDLPLR